MTSYTDRLCAHCETFTQHLILVPRAWWRCLNCDRESGTVRARHASSRPARRTRDDDDLGHQLRLVVIALHACADARRLGLMTLGTPDDWAAHAATCWRAAELLDKPRTP